MAILIANSFSSFSLAPEEEESGQVFNLNQKMVLQNKLSAIAEEKVNLVFTPDMPLQYAQREAELAGQMGIIRWLLDTSQQVEEELALRLQPPQE